jgi:dTDP-4-dehydrorhamnose 3,5-epimerase
MKIQRTKFPEVLLIEPVVFTDGRGEFMEVFNEKEMASVGISPSFVQDNLSYSRKGVLRGLHYQIRQPQGKLVRCAKGSVFDVIVDLRRSSPMFGQHLSAVLSERRTMLWVPAGFAHGFLALEDGVCFEYKVTDYHAPDHERTIRWNDEDLRIEWPLTPEEIIVSEKDRRGVQLREAEMYS